MRNKIYMAATAAAFMWLSAATTLQAQDPRLAREYFSSGEYEKAADIYQQLHEKERKQDYYYERYLTTLLELQDYKSAEEMLKKAIKSAPDKIERYVDYGNIFARQDQTEKANEQYDKAVKMLGADQIQIIKLAEAFNTRKLYDYSIQTYEKGEKLLKEKHAFAYELGAVYFQKGETSKMITSYLDALDFQPSRLTNIQAFFQRSMPPETGFDELKKQLYTRIQKNDKNIMYPELLIWVFTQEGDYSNALRQAKALDKRLNDNGSRVFRLAQSAMSERKYAAAIEGYQYIAKEKGIESSYYIESRENILRAKQANLIELATYTQQDLKDLESDYESFLSEFGRSRTTADIMQDLADFEARYLYNLDKAIAILEEVIKIPQLPAMVLSQAKLELGDYYLMKGDPWEATLLYSQVDKALKDAPLGEVARFKNAKLSYYKGDFEWAQGQLEVIKGSTSELMSNDAIELSVFIMEHLNLDTSAMAMQLFADADLLRFQNRDDAALQKMDSLLQNFKEHGLVDDVILAKAEIAQKRRQYSKAAEYYQSIIDNHKEGILVDNAIFALAQLYETRLDDKAKAMELYDKIIIDYSSSLFVVEARKCYRRLRGDELP
jgi:tetratricopeptide (TPR) repeat protein